MREILFRGKRLDNGEWVYGHFYTQLYLPDTIEEEWYWFIKPIGSESWVSYRVDPITVGQYTGMKDKNGKRIFEGDILGSRYDNLYPDDVAIEVVKWFRNGWYIQQENNLPDALCEYGVLPYSEVIGNVHDNPELIKEEAQP